MEAEDPSGSVAHKEVTLEINGVNDAPHLVAGDGETELSLSEHFLSFDATNDLEGGAFSHDFSQYFEDIDLNDNIVDYSLELSLPEGARSLLSEADFAKLEADIQNAFKISSNGTFELKNGLSLDSLTQGENFDISITVKAEDSHGGISEGKDFTLKVHGVNDAPTLVAGDGETGFAISEHFQSFDVANDAEGGKFSHDLSQYFEDVDLNDSIASYSLEVKIPDSAASLLSAEDFAKLQADIQDAFTISSTGELTLKDGFTLESLTKGKDFDLTLTVKAEDNHGAISEGKDITITVHGVNDDVVFTPGNTAPRMEVSDKGVGWKNNAELTDGSDTTLDLTKYFHDPDHDDTISFDIIGLSSSNTQEELNARLDPDDIIALELYINTALSNGDIKIENGSLIFKNGSLVLKSLTKDNYLDLTLEISAQDEFGTSVEGDFKIRVNGVNDAPVRISEDHVSFEISESGNVWVNGAEDANTAFADEVHDLSSYFEDYDKGETASLSFTLDGITIELTGNASFTETELKAIKASISIEGKNIKFASSDVLDKIAKLGDGDSIKISVDVKASDGEASSESKTLDYIIHGQDFGPAMADIFEASVHEPGGIGNKFITEAEANELSGNTQRVGNLKFESADPDSEMTVTIHLGGQSISFTADANGNLIGGDNLVLNGEWGQLRYNASEKYWVYEPFKKAETLNSDAHGIDEFNISAVDNKGMQSNDSVLKIEVKGSDDGISIDGALGITHNNGLALEPFVGSETTTLTGTLNIMDIDDHDSSISFQVQDSAGKWVSGTENGDGSYSFELSYGTLTLTWDGTATNTLDGQDLLGKDPGAWVYEYKVSDDVDRNKILSEDIHIKALDPDLADGQGSVEIDFTVDIVSSDFGDNVPQPSYDKIVVEDGVAWFKHEDDLIDMSTGNCNLLANDKLIGGENPAAILEDGVWVPQGGITVNVDGSSETKVVGNGQLIINSDGTVKYIPSPSESLEIKALGEGETKSYTTSYTVNENGQESTSYIIVEFVGKNDAPEANNIRVDVIHGFGEDQGVVLIDQKLAYDPDSADLSYTFSFDGNVLTATDSVSSTFDFSHFGNKDDQGFKFDPNNNPDDLNQDGLFQQIIDIPGAKIFTVGDYGWLVDDGGELSFHVNKNNPEIIKLGKNEYKDITIDFGVSDGSASDDDSITIRIDGQFDKLLVHDITKEAAKDQGSRYVNEDGVIIYGSTGAGSRLDPETGMPIKGGTVDYDGQSHTGVGMLGQFNIITDLQGFVTKLDGNASTTVNFTNKVTTVFGRVEVSPGKFEYVELGELRVNYNTSLSFNAKDGEYDRLWGLDLGVTKLYVKDGSSYKPYQLTVTNTDDQSTTDTLIDVDFEMAFVNDMPVINGAKISLGSSSLAEGKVSYHDVDTDSSLLQLWVMNPLDHGKMNLIEADGTSIEYSFGTLTINKDGSFTFEKSDQYTGNEKIKIAVSDGNTAAESLIQISEAQDTASLGTDYLSATFTSGNVFNISAVINNSRGKSLLANDKGLADDATVLNAGTYILSNLVIKFKGSDLDNYDDKFDLITGGKYNSNHEIKGGKAEGVSEHFYTDGDGRFEILLDNMVVNINSAGEVVIQGKPSMNILDTETGRIYSITYEKNKITFKAIADDMNASNNLEPGDPGYMTYEDVKGLLDINFEYQTTDANGNLVSGELVIEFGEFYGDGRPAADGGVTSENIISNYKIDTAYDTTNLDGEHHLAGGTQSSVKGGIRLGIDHDADDLHFKVGSYDENGKFIVDSGGHQSFAEYIGLDNIRLPNRPGADANGNYNESTLSIGVNGDAPTLEVPIYVWYNSITGVFGQSKEEAGAGAKCLEVGVGNLIFTSAGREYFLGYDENGEPIYHASYNNIISHLEVSFFDKSENPIVAELIQALRDMSEGAQKNYLIYGLQLADQAEGGNTRHVEYKISFTGADVILGPDGRNYEIKVFEDEALTADIFSSQNAKHTFVDGKDSTSRSDIDGWDKVSFKSYDDNGKLVDKEVSLDQAHTISGKYGQLVWNTATNKYDYKVYEDSRGDEVRRMVDGEKMQERFEYTATDKNGEKGSGTTVITINGKNDGFTTDLPANEIISEAESKTWDFSKNFTTRDGGDITYAVQIFDVDGNLIWSSVGEGSISEFTNAYGKFTFFADSGELVFNPTGILDEGEDYKFKLKVQAQVDSGQGKIQYSGWEDMEVVLNGVDETADSASIAKAAFGSFFESEAEQGVEALEDTAKDSQLENTPVDLEASEAEGFRGESEVSTMATYDAYSIESEGETREVEELDAVTLSSDEHAENLELEENYDDIILPPEGVKFETPEGEDSYANEELYSLDMGVLLEETQDSSGLDTLLDDATGAVGSDKTDGKTLGEGELIASMDKEGLSEAGGSDYVEYSAPESLNQVDVDVDEQALIEAIKSITG